MSELEMRAAQLAAVDFPKRTIELIVMPYESETRVGYRGRMITEIVSRGAFGNISASRRRVAVNLHHDIPDVIGKAVAFYPSRQEGLVAEVKIAASDVGERSLIHASEGLLDASAGFELKRNETDAQVWETSTRRRLNHLWLHHIALTPDPAYEEARVLAVRNAAEPLQEPHTAVATPNLDLVRSWRLNDAYRRLDDSLLSR
jgi:HK97 family phage prohead protease